MIRIKVYYLALIIFIGCNTQKRSIKITERERLIDEQLIDLSQYLSLQWDNTYKFWHEKINLPDDYKERTWSKEMSGIWKGNELDTINIKYLIFEEMLNSLFEDSLGNISYAQIINYFGKPSNSNLLINTKEYRNLLYLFNTLNNPNCSCRTSKNHYLGSNCSIIEFEFDDSGTLSKINTLMFSP